MWVNYWWHRFIVNSYCMSVVSWCVHTLWSYIAHHPQVGLTSKQVIKIPTIVIGRKYTARSNINSDIWIVECCYSNHLITRISIQTAGLAFGVTGLGSYRVRGVNSICDVWIGFKLCFSANLSHHSLPFFSWTDSTDSPDGLPILLSISVFTL